MAGDFIGDGTRQLVAVPDVSGAPGHQLWALTCGRGARAWQHLSPLAAHPFLADIDCAAGAAAPLAVGVKLALVADIDGDRRDELIVVPDAPGSAVWALALDPVTRRWRHLDAIPAAAGRVVKFILAADVDGDGRDEVLLASDAGAVSVAKLDPGNGRWRPLPALPTQPLAPRFAVAGDFDGDGRAELVVAPETAGSAGNDLWAWKLDRAGTRWNHLSPIPGHPFGADINCDAKPNLPPAAFGAKLAVAADFDGDGRDELVVAPAVAGTAGNDLWALKLDPAQGRWVHLGSLPGFGADINCDLDAAVPTSFGVKLAVAGDFDRDGRAELLVAPDISGTAGSDFWVMKLDPGTGTWRHFSPIAGHPFVADLNCDADLGTPVSFGVKQILAADFDGDGKDEIAVLPDLPGTAGNDLWAFGFRPDPRPGLSSPLGGRHAAIVRGGSFEGLCGYVDLHTHPAAHLGFGTELFYGAPDGDPAVALGNCNQMHGGVGLFDNPRANEFRHVLVDKLQAQDGVPGWDHKRQGYPDFAAWPSWHDRLHQQMWVDWLRRAWLGGLRVTVALATNSHVLADAAETQGPYDDRSAGDNQLREIIALAGRNRDFMEVVRTPSELRATVEAGRLALVLGVELDCIGNFYQPANAHHSGAGYNPNPTAADVDAEIERLFSLGVRYFFPLHITDNVFGGAALYDRTFESANRYCSGRHYQVEAAPAASRIGYSHQDRRGLFDQVLEGVAAAAVLGFDPLSDTPAPPATTTGHRNSRALTALGEHLIRKLISLGALIDLDHMSERTAARVLEIAGRTRYPVCAGHAGVRGDGGTERQHLPATLQSMYRDGGLWGLGLAGGLEPLRDTVRRARSLVPEAAFGLGSDCCGFDHLPRPRFGGVAATDAATRASLGMVVYRDNPGAAADALVPCRTGNRRWDYSVEGCAHIGLFPDMLEELVSSELLGREDLLGLFRSAEAFARTWERCLARRSRRVT